MKNKLANSILALTMLIGGMASAVAIIANSQEDQFDVPYFLYGGAAIFLIMGYFLLRSNMKNFTNVALFVVWSVAFSFFALIVIWIVEINLDSQTNVNALMFGCFLAYVILSYYFIYKS